MTYFKTTDIINGSYYGRLIDSLFIAQSDAYLKTTTFQNFTANYMEKEERCLVVYS
jgi:hypothetical protein